MRDGTDNKLLAMNNNKVQLLPDSGRGRVDAYICLLLLPVLLLLLCPFSGPFSAESVMNFR